MTGIPLPPTASTPVLTVANKTFLDEDGFEDAITHLVNDYRTRGVTILKRILQGSNPQYTAAHRAHGAQFKFDRDGVCDAMSMEFIRLGLRGGTGAADFRALIDGNWAYLGLVQSEFTSLKRQTAKPLLDLDRDMGAATRKHDESVREYERAGPVGRLFGSLGIGSVPSEAQYKLSKTALEAKQRVINAQADAVGQALKDLQANTVYATNDPSVLARREDVFADEVPLAGLVPALMAAFDRPGYYYLKLAGGGKHAMAFEIAASGRGHRFMDPNGYELQIATRGFMRPFLVDYFRIYQSPRWGSFQHAEASLVRFT